MFKILPQVIFLILGYLVVESQTQTVGDLRLQDNGILEIFYDNSWGHICDDFWSLSATNVACRKLGYRGAKSYSTGVTLTTKDFHLDNIICIGNESSLMDCDSITVHDCNVNEHVAISCEKDGCESYAPFADANSKIVEYYTDSNWYYICGEEFTQENADVICRENTQTTAENYTFEIPSENMQRGIYPFKFECRGDENSLCACRKDEIKCESIVRVKCRSDEGKITLIPGTNNQSGFVLINHLEQWKMICLESSSTNFPTAYVACKQLGHKGVYNFYYGDSVVNQLYSSNYFLDLYKKLDSWINNPICTGKEQKIGECNFNGWTQSSCMQSPLWVDCQPYVGARSYQRHKTISKTGNRYITPGYKCSDGEESLKSCYFDNLNTTRCEDGDEIYLHCNLPLDETPSLSYGSSDIGIVDIYSSGYWGLACLNNPSFSQNDVRVICNDLGLKGSTWRSIKSVKNLRDSYWNSSFNCIGNESSLSDGKCLEILEIRPKRECRQSYNLMKVYCRPAFNEMRLLLSNKNSSFYKVQFLTPQRIWAPYCTSSHEQHAQQICNMFGFESLNRQTNILEHKYIFAQIACSRDESRIDHCQVKFMYDYISIYGCTTSLMISCNNLTAPRFPIDILEGISTNPNSVLLRWEYTYSISEENMNFSYYLDIAYNNVQTRKEIELNHIDQNLKSRYYTVWNLRSYVEYSFGIILKNSAGFGPHGKAINMMTQELVLPPPKTPTLVDKSKNSIKIRFERYNIHVAYNYSICVSKTGVNDCEVILITSKMIFLIEDLEPETLYYVKITVVTQYIRSPPSEILTVRTTKENNPPIIIVPAQNASLTIRDIQLHETFNLTQECIATGVPQPNIHWTSYTEINLSIGNLLEIKPGDLSKFGEINPIIFACIANNSAGEVSRTIEILIKIEVSDIIETLVNVTDENANEFSNILTRNTNGVDTSAENTTDTRRELDSTANDLDNLVTKYILNKTVDESKRVVVENILKTAAAIIKKDNELSEQEEDKDNDETSIATASKAFRITLQTVENLASKIADGLERSDNENEIVFSNNAISIIAENIILTKDDTNATQLLIPMKRNTEEKKIEEVIAIPYGVARMLSGNGRNLKIATTIIKNEPRKSESDDADSSKLFSNIVSLLVPQQGRPNQRVYLPEPIKLIFPVSTNDLTEFNQICSFLNTSYWSSEGLRTEEMKNVTNCYTNHLTSFAVFVTPRMLGGSDELRRVASIVSYVIVSISFLALVVSLALFILSGKKFFQIEANIVYFNYCLSLTLAFGVFLFGIETGTFNEIACKVIAFLLHYLWLAVFVWTLCNGILILYKLTIGILRDHKIYPYLIVFGWCFPLIIPTITVGIRYGSYVKAEEHCFLTHEDGIIWAFICPIIAIILINMIILIISVIRISTTKFGSEKLKEKQIIKTAIVSTLILTPLLGIPWILLVLNIFIVDPLIQWVFIITNGLMGVFFFFAITMRNAEVKILLKMKKGEYSQMAATSNTDGKSSRLLSKKFKRSVSRDTSETLSQTNTSQSKKGEYFQLGRMGSSQAQDDEGSLKSPTGSLGSRYNTPPRPKNFPKPKKFKSSTEEEKIETHYDVPVNLKPVQPNIYDVLKPKDHEESKAENDSPQYENGPETSFIGYDYVSDVKSTQPIPGEKVKEVEKRVHLSLNQN